MFKLRKKQRAIINLSFFGLLLLVFIVLNILKTFPYIADWWSVNISQYYILGVGFLTKFLPFSLFEVIIVLIIFAVICFVIRWIYLLNKRKVQQVIMSILSLVSIVLVFSNIYTLSAGFAYYRTEMPMEISEKQYDKEEVEQVAKYFTEDFNALSAKLKRNVAGNVIPPYSFTELRKRISLEFNKLSDSYFYKFTPPVKPIVNSWFMTETSICGITFAPTAEANINYLMPDSDKPFTMAHELAHVKGVMRESDANMLADYILFNSNDDYLRYCGYFNSLYKIDRMLYLSNENDYENVILPEKAKEITIEMNNASYYWMNRVGIFDSISNFFNNIYLKLSGVTEGTDSYIDIGTLEPGVGEDGELIYIPKFSRTEKMIFAIYENFIKY